MAPPRSALAEGNKNIYWNIKRQYTEWINDVKFNHVRQHHTMTGHLAMTDTESLRVVQLQSFFNFMRNFKIHAQNAKLIFKKIVILISNINFLLTVDNSLKENLIKPR